MVNVFVPETLAEALRIRGQHETLVINGGTDVMVKYRRWNGMPPDFPLDVLHIGNLAELKHIEIAEGKLMIGAAVTLSELLEHPYGAGLHQTADSSIGFPCHPEHGDTGGKPLQRLCIG